MRDIDIAFIATVQNLSPNYDTRRLISIMLKKLQPEYKVFIGNVYEQEYDKTLSRSKILIVETAQSGYVVQRYLQGAVHGCVLVGEVPVMDRRVWQDNFNIIGVDDWTTLPEILGALLQNPARMQRLAFNALRTVQEKYSMAVSVKDFIEKVR